MVKRTVTVLLMLLLATSLIMATGSGEDAADGSGEEKVTLVMGSWRTDDVTQMKALLKEFNAAYPNIEVVFQPTNPPDYNATLRLQLESGTGPDLMYARSYVTGLGLFKEGYFAELSDLENINTSYDAGTRSPWADENGKSFAIPFIAVSHGVYYNIDIFNELGLSVPDTWDELLSVSQAIKNAGYIPIANALGDEWDIAEVVFMSIAPNFIGGRDGRLAYDDGERAFNDDHVVSLFEAMGSLKPYLPAGFEALTYNDSNALFATGQAAMYFDGSWTLGTFSDVDFEWSVFAPPVPEAGDDAYICFHADAGMAMNSSTEYPEQAKLFLEWLGTKEGAQASASNLPTGMFPMSKHAVEISDTHANDFLALNQGRGTDVRWVWPKLLGGEPSGYGLVMNGSISVITGSITPQEAADNFQNGLAKWYAPAQQ
jgi:raffinose/stachyose/melibiose transport system substrate-binding protein